MWRKTWVFRVRMVEKGGERGEERRGEERRVEERKKRGG